MCRHGGWHGNYCREINNIHFFTFKFQHVVRKTLLPAQIRRVRAVYDEPKVGDHGALPMLSTTWTSENHGVKNTVFADATTHLRWAPSRQKSYKCLLFKVYSLDVVSRNLLQINALRIARHWSGRVMQTTPTNRNVSLEAMYSIWAMKMP